MGWQVPSLHWKSQYSSTSSFEASLSVLIDARVVEYGHLVVVRGVMICRILGLKADTTGLYGEVLTEV